VNKKTVFQTGMINRVIFLGGGSAGFIAALALKRKLRDLEVLVICSKDIGIIGVGEGSTPGLTRFLHQYLGVNLKKFFAVAHRPGSWGSAFCGGMTFRAGACFKTPLRRV
jgi:tryptophan halogenase